MRNSGPNIDEMLRRLDSDLRRLPRHEWDGYLWRLCTQLVGASGAPAHGEEIIDAAEAREQRGEV